MEGKGEAAALLSRPAVVLSHDQRKDLLDWTAKQGRILTCHGKAVEYYTPERGFPFSPDECPHHHLLNNSTHQTFHNWARERSSSSSSSSPSSDQEKNPVCGAFFRPLFVGGWEHSTDNDEMVYNVQTNTLFIDLRIPKFGRRMSKKHATRGEGSSSWEDYTDDELKLMARRHAFSGYTQWEEVEVESSSTTTMNKKRPVCTRHHCIDYNFVGIPRPRPNKWYVEMNQDKQTWKEWAYAKDEFGQHYYWERWQRWERDADGNGLVLALRRDEDASDGRDGILVVVGDHFNYIVDRKVKKKGIRSSAIECIDAAIDSGDRATAESYLSMDAGHGLISNGWTIDCALHPWKEGTQFLTKANVSFVEGDSPDDVASCKVVINDCTYSIYECNVSMEELQTVLHYNGQVLGRNERQENAALKSILFHKTNQPSRKRKAET